MDIFKAATVILGLAGLAIGLYAAFLWKAASEIVIITLSVENGWIQPVDLALAHAEWIVAINKYAEKSGKLNSRAAKWTAASVLCSSLSGFVGLLG